MKVTTRKPSPKSAAELRQIDIDREKVRRGGLRAFTRMAWPIVEPAVPYVHGFHVDAISDHLTACYRGDIRHLLINVPPGCMKSRMTCVFGPAYAWIQEPGMAWLFASFDARLTLRDSVATLQLLQSEWFRDRWGSTVSVGDDVAGAMFYTLQGGFRLATSVRGKATGTHPDVVTIDDPLKADDAGSKVAMQACRDWWSNTILSRARNPATVRRICIMQRLHQDDLAQMFIDSGNWTHLNLPMRYEPKSPCISYLTADLPKKGERATAEPFFQDPRIEEGELLWPERFPEDAVKNLENPDGGMTAQVVAAQLQQRPSPASGSVFKREWFKTFTRAQTPTSFDSICQSWDCTFKDTAGSDFVVGQVWGRRGGEFYLLDEKRSRLSFPDTVTAIKEMRVRWPKVHAILIEDKANGPAVETVIKKDVPGVIMVNPEGGKHLRANAAAVFFEAGNVYHPEPFGKLVVRAKSGDVIDERPDVWVFEHREELATFPAASYDDRVDSCSQALIWLASKRSTLQAAMAELRKNPGNPFGNR